MVCSVNHAPQGLEICARVKFRVFSKSHTSGLRKHGCKYVSDLSHSFCYGIYCKKIS